MTDTSQTQLEANQQNAELSTGPTTEEGKAVSSMNALKHGLLSKEVLLPGKDEQTLTELREQLKQELQPEGELEAILVDRIVCNTWRLRRAIEVERNSMQWQNEYKDVDFGLDPNKD